MDYIGSLILFIPIIIIGILFIFGGVKRIRNRESLTFTWGGSPIINKGKYAIQDGYFFIIFGITLFLCAIIYYLGWEIHIAGNTQVIKRSFNSFGTCVCFRCFKSNDIKSLHKIKKRIIQLIFYWELSSWLLSV